VRLGSHLTNTQFMKIIETTITDVKILKPKVYNDERGFFYESFNEELFRKLIGQDFKFVQDNHSMSQLGVLRGLHYQIQQAQGKLVRVIRGKVFDVAVDIRQSSPSFGHWVGEILSADNYLQMWIPPGFAHGFLVLSENTEILYKTTEFYAPEHERTIQWNDVGMGIDWPIDGLDIRLSNKDKDGTAFALAEYFD